MAQTALIAVGGNSLIRAGEKGTIAEQLANTRRTAEAIVQIIRAGFHVVVTHGNGPQVGAALLRSERAADQVYTHPLDVCDATTQGEIGYLLPAVAAARSWRSAGMRTPVVDGADAGGGVARRPGDANPTKPIGPFYSRAGGRASAASSSAGTSSRTPRAATAAWCRRPSRWRSSKRTSSARLIDTGRPRHRRRRRRHPGGAVGSRAPRRRGRHRQGPRVGAAGVAARRGPASSSRPTPIGCTWTTRSPTSGRWTRVTAAEMEAHYEDGPVPARQHGTEGRVGVALPARTAGSEVIITSYERLLDAVRGQAGTHISG